MQPDLVTDVQEAVLSTGLACTDVPEVRYSAAVHVEGGGYNVPFACCLWIYIVAVL